MQNVALKFSPITLLASTSMMLVVHPSLQVKTLAEFVKAAKAQKGELAFASSGNGTIPGG